MFDSAVLTIAGNVVADPKVVGDAESPERVAFRVVSNRRRRDDETGEWKQVGEYGINVVCWRRLARGVAQALRKGDPVLVRGRLSEHRFVGNDNQTRWMTELTADFVGHDLSQGHAGRFSRFTRIDAATARADAARAEADRVPGDAEGDAGEGVAESVAGADPFGAAGEVDDDPVDAADPSDGSDAFDAAQSALAAAF